MLVGTREPVDEIADVGIECGFQFFEHLDGFTVDGAKKLVDLGVTDVIVGFRNVYDQDTMPLQKKINALRLYDDHVIAKSEAA